MAFKFSAGEPVDAGFRRIVTEQALKASQAARTGTDDPQAAIYAIRRRVKKIRAALRLVRGNFDGYAHENAVLRDAARALGHLRDRPVVLATYDDLVASQALAPAPEERAALAARLATTPSADPAAALAAFAIVIDVLAQRAQTWTLRQSGFAALQPGLARTYRRTRQAFHHARRRPTAENFHEWRKLVKYHAHHLGLISAGAPHILLAERLAANDLADLLGRHHDLDVLLVHLEETSSLIPAIAQRKAELEAQANTLGLELTAEPPKTFETRCASYWPGQGSI